MFEIILAVLIQGTIINSNLCDTSDLSCVKNFTQTVQVQKTLQDQFPPSPPSLKPQTPEQVAKQKAKDAKKIQELKTGPSLQKQICNALTIGLKCKTLKIKPNAVRAASVAAAVPLPAGCSWVLNTSGGQDIVCSANYDPFVNSAGCKDPTGASGPCDLHLRADVYTNAAIGRAECLPGIVDTDKDGNPRPMSDGNHPPGMGCDIGAYQFTGSSSNLQPLPPPTGFISACNSATGTLSFAWNAVPNATDYWTRAEYVDNGMTIPEAMKDGGNPATTIIFPVQQARTVHFWVHGFNVLYPPADPSYPMGVGYYAGANAICNFVPSTFKAQFLGMTGEDFVSGTQFMPDGLPDWHFSVQGLRGVPVRTKITAPCPGFICVWETPFNNAGDFVIYSTTNFPNAEWFVTGFEPVPSLFHLTVFYSDNTSDEADATIGPSPQPPQPPTNLRLGSITQ